MDVEIEPERSATWGPWRLDWLPDGASREYEPQLAYDGISPVYLGCEGFPLWSFDRPEKLLAELFVAIPVLSLDDLRALVAALQDLGVLDGFRENRGRGGVGAVCRLLRARGWPPPNEVAW